jgi:hypothetical protein
LGGASILSNIDLRFGYHQVRIKDVYDIRSFMGLAGYYRRFIKGFSKIGCPITALQKRGLNSLGQQSVKKYFRN